MTYAEIQKMLGNPDEIVVLDDGNEKYVYRKQGLEFYMNKSKRAEVLVVLNSSYKTNRGFSVGGSKSFAEKSLGSDYVEIPVRIREGGEDKGYRTWQYPGLTVVWNEPYTQAHEDIKNERAAIENEIQNNRYYLFLQGELRMANPNAPENAEIRAERLRLDYLENRNESLRKQYSDLNSNNNTVPTAKYISVVKK
jgi:hypothetical protein